MNIYKCLNDITNYIDEHLEEKINYDTLAKFIGVNTYTMQRIFSLIAGIPLSEYIRKRRLSTAGFDLYDSNQKIIDIAIKYQYDNATSFSRAFESFHGIKPSLVNKMTKLKNFPRIIFNEDITLTNELEYEIIELDAFTLYGIGIKTTNDTIHEDAPKLYQKTDKLYNKEYGEIPYAMVTYEDDMRENVSGYYILYTKKIPNSKEINIPASKWLKFRIHSQVASEIQEMSEKFYYEFLPSCKYNLKEIPELEHYHDGITDFLVPIY